MTLHDHTIDIETLGPEAAAACRRAASGDAVIVTHSGLPVVAVVSVDSLTALQRDRDLLRRLALGDLESAAGAGEDLESVLFECRLLLEES